MARARDRGSGRRGCEAPCRQILLLGISRTFLGDVGAVSEMWTLRESWPFVVAASTCTCFALEYGSPALFRQLSKGYSALDEKQRLDWDVRFVGLLHGAHHSAV